MPPAEPLLDHERLEVYQLARHHARESAALIRQLPRGRADVLDQYRRASLSLPLNISEGAGEFAPREKARLYRIARRSADECSALLDHLVDLDLATPEQIRPAKHLLRRIVGAMVKLIQSTERATGAVQQDAGRAHHPGRAQRAPGPSPPHKPPRKPAPGPHPSP
jgi:four helix bundle protein